MNIYKDVTPGLFDLLATSFHAFASLLCNILSLFFCFRHVLWFNAKILSINFAVTVFVRNLYIGSTAFCARKTSSLQISRTIKMLP